MKIWNIPIESLEERYSADWNRWFPTEFEKAEIEYETIYGDELTQKIEQGSFLDVIGTNYFKASQIQKICKKIYSGEVKENDVFLFHDLWFPGLESLAYIRDALKLKFKIVGIMHAGTWDQHDFLSHQGMIKWGMSLEESWFSFIDCIFVATEFHKSLILNSRKVQCPIYVTGLPIYDTHSNVKSKKEKIIVFPHRLDPEKKPEDFDELEGMFREKYPKLSDWKFVKSKEVTKTKQMYYDLLNRSTIAVSTAFQETWGIAMQEALFAGCITFVPNRLSYYEMYHQMLKYTGLKELLSKIGVFINSEQGQTSYKYFADETRNNLKRKGEAAISKMLRYIRELK